MPDDTPPQGPQHDLSPATLAVWAGEGEETVGGATQVPVVYSAAYGYPDVDEWLAVALGRTPGHIYSRNTNPTVHAFEEKVRILEGGVAATSFSTGMAAISNTLFALLRSGERVVSVRDTYGGTNRIFLEFLPRIGIVVDLQDTGDHEAIEAAIAGGTRLLYLETPTNPTLKVLDIARLAAAGHAAGAIVVVDNTFATPINQSPLALGADLVVHSATKFLGGHADALGGVIVGDAALVAEVFHFREITGATLDPMAAYLLIRGLKTLSLRIRQQNESALRIARWLEAQPGVAVVNYPGPREPSAPRRGSPPDARLRRRAELRPGRRVRRRQAGAAPPAPGPPRRQPRCGGDHRRPAGHHEPRRVHGRGARGHGHPRGSHPLLGRHRRPGRPHRGPCAGVGDPLGPARGASV